MHFAVNDAKWTELVLQVIESVLRVCYTDRVCVEADSKPEIMFYTNQTQNPAGGGSTVVVGLEGQTISLRCFFSGRYLASCAYMSLRIF